MVLHFLFLIHSIFLSKYTHKFWLSHQDLLAKPQLQSISPLLNFFLENSFTLIFFWSHKTHNFNGVTVFPYFLDVSFFHNRCILTSSSCCISSLSRDPALLLGNLLPLEWGENTNQPKTILFVSHCRDHFTGFYNFFTHFWRLLSRSHTRISPVFQEFDSFEVKLWSNI